MRELHVCTLKTPRSPVLSRTVNNCKVSTISHCHRVLELELTFVPVGQIFKGVSVLVCLKCQRVYNIDCLHLIYVLWDARIRDHVRLRRKFEGTIMKIGFVLWCYILYASSHLNSWTVPGKDDMLGIYSMG